MKLFLPIVNETIEDVSLPNWDVDETWIAIDNNGSVYAFFRRPVLELSMYQWLMSDDVNPDARYCKLATLDNNSVTEWYSCVWPLRDLISTATAVRIEDPTFGLL